MAIIASIVFFVSYEWRFARRPTLLPALVLRAFITDAISSRRARQPS
jgi:hypothetical protein